MKGEGEKGDWIYGINPVLEAIKSGRKINALYIHNQRHEQIQNIIRIAKGKDIPIK
ncbi:MAG: 23S rRNA (guanosine(2251)-2'-O)-methyltransferase RlmB, partial [Nitrospirae bacterium]|nr:23S rRNA (guanosine(2251)-2'-O)-methyltransferase RlmB [Nitrospirota bacterium]